MKFILYSLFLFPHFLIANFDEFFSENEDPAHFHHVNVITGHLNLTFHDASILGARSIPISRTYSSSGALEYSYLEDPDLFYRGMRRGWIVQGGWSLYPHEHLLIETNRKREEFKIYISEPNGSMITYAYSHQKERCKHTVFFKPSKNISQFSGRLGRRSNPQYNLLEIDLEAGVAILYLPNGGSRTYRGRKLHHHEKLPYWERPQHFYLLCEERDPSGNVFQYTHDKNRTHLQKVESKNSAGTKVYASLDIEYVRPQKKSPQFQLKLTGSDGKYLEYGSICNEHRAYINELTSNCNPHQKVHYIPGRKGIGLRIESIDLGGKETFKVVYFLPGNVDQERKWAKKPNKVEFHIDKVKELFQPVGPNGEDVKVADFGYYTNHTDVRDAEGLLIRYHHDSERLNLVEYFDEKDRLRSSQKFYWNGTELCCKAMFDANQKPIFAKTFVHSNGNVIEEVLWGQFSGKETSPLQVSDMGKASGAESYRKTYSYYENPRNVIKTEWEEEGPSYEYEYKDGTDLCTLKLTKDKNGKILIREFFAYDEDNFLIEEVIDDGMTKDPKDVSQVTQRLIKRYLRNPSSGLPDWVLEFYWDPAIKAEKLLKKTKYHFKNQRVDSEEVFDAEGKSRYVAEIEYDNFGFVTRRTTPSGKENTYRYNGQGCLEESKEVGSPKKIFHYDNGNRLSSCEEPNTKKTSTITYNPKGRVISETDFRKNQVIHAHDHFGNRKSSELPACLDENGQKYKPIPKFDYDIQGNLTLAEMPGNEKTETSYNIYRKPILIIQADGTQIQHFYNKNGSLSKTLFLDGTEICYEYDLFQRLTSKIIISKDQKLLSSESWEYGSFQLLSYTDSRGLTVKFNYDGAGRKISEEAEKRKTTFSYDPLGFLEKTDDGAVAFCQKRNVDGLIEEQWEEDSAGHVENKMFFFYDEENRKNKVIRETSKGKAIDLITYKDGKLASHTDPLNSITQFIHNEFYENELGQKVLQKTIVDPLGLSTVETFDAAERLSLKEKKDALGQTVFKEEFFYDRSGNKAKQISHVYKDNQVIRQIPIIWEYDDMGRVNAEIESDQKRTLFDYDIRGRLTQKTLPNGIIIQFDYDGADRLEGVHSSDGKINIRNIYERGPEPTQILDLINGTTLKRSYNLFGQIISETDSRGKTCEWEYDSVGRCIAFTLPDGSSIHYPHSGKHMQSVQRKNSRGDILYEHVYKAFDPNGHVAIEDLIYDLGKIQTVHDLLERPSSQSCQYIQHEIRYGNSGLVTRTNNSFFGEKLYEYDGLNQLTREGEQPYHFDSLGNPVEFGVNDLNQIFMTPECTIAYDDNGYPKEKIAKEDHVQYEFDPIGRLIEITTLGKRKVRYSYDPLSRLYSKEIYHFEDNQWQRGSKFFYLYDRDQEIGLQDESGDISELKVLGLGIRGDIGATVAIEIQQDVFAPLHDFSGNIIALLSSEGQIIEKYEIDVFGKEKISNPKNPWRFSSKRSEEGLVFFGFRFYDPNLGRWLSPDPAGFADGANLYLYVHNNPLNRLDLFGLITEDRSDSSIEIIIQESAIPFDNTLFSVRMWEGEIMVDYFLSCGHWHELKLTPHEQEMGCFNLFDHGELFAAADGQIGFVTFTHGINTQRDEFENSCNYMIDGLPGQPLFIGRYYGTEGFGKDAYGAGKDLCGIETVQVCLARQFLLTCSDALHKVNPAKFDDGGKLLSLGALWSHYNHSRGGVMDLRAMEGMPYEQQKILQTQLLMTSVAPAWPTPRDMGLEVINYYSKQDGVTGGFGAPHIPAALIFGLVGGLAAKSKWDHSDCEIKFVSCKSTWSERSFYLADHAIMGGTYRGVLDESIRLNVQNYGYYNGKNR
ncbi:MAG: hypothetical protein K1X28_01450 [Parachlamydiales bacterium]|nr:hypothetical protein [Parachlamydiales bacterium]